MKVLTPAYLCLCLLACGQVKDHTPTITAVPAPQQNSHSVTVHKKENNTPVPGFDNAHPHAKLLLTEPFYFSAVDEAAPFGNPEGIDGYRDFYAWRPSHKKNDPIELLTAHINSLGYPKFDIKETDIGNLLAYTQAYELGNRFITGTDAVIISIAFSQLYLEGVIDKDLKGLARIAIQRQVIPELLAAWGDPYKTERKKKLTKMLAVIK